MSRTTITVLLVEDDPVAAGLFHAQLAGDFTTRYEFERAGSVREALAALEQGKFDVVVLDLILPDARGLEALRGVRAAAPGLPIVVLTGIDDETLAVEALNEGAQDYLVKGDLSGRLISRSLRYAIERHRLTETLRGLSLLDELTGLFNRRGFLTLGETQRKLAQRTERGMALIRIDVARGGDGRPPGDRELRSIAATLRDTFRASDLVGRLGPDRLAVLAVEPTRDLAAAPVARLREQLGSDPAPARVTLEWHAPDDLDDLDLTAWAEG